MNLQNQAQKGKVLSSVATGSDSFADGDLSHSSSTGPTVTLREGYLGTISQEFARFAKRQYTNATMYKGHDDRRCEERHPLLVPVLAVGIDDNGRPLGTPFEMITRDVSDSALGLLSAEPMPHDRMAGKFELNERVIVFSAELIRRESRGPFFGCAVRFLEELEEFPLHPSEIAAVRQSLSGQSGYDSNGSSWN